MYDGMQAMTHRTTFALDRDTAQRLARLASRWNVSKAEVVRRAVAQAESSAGPAPDPVGMLQQLHAAGDGLDREAATRYIEEVRQARGTWRGR